MTDRTGSSEPGSATTSLSQAFLRNVARGADPDSDHALAGELLVAPDLGPLAARFELERRIGAGGFGVVYEARDRQQAASVALKLLARESGRALYRFKHEFRSLAGLAHPNLVRLHELHCETLPWFFTMELVRGVDALSFVGGDPERLRSVFAQVVEGLCFFHDTGRVHCDVKPSNVMVEPGGRVVLLDFGLAVELAEHGPEGALGPAGTRPYMAPEQVAGRPPMPATDWYAVGVMLYQCLTGKLPPGAGEPLPEVAPSDLRLLCEELLRPDPTQRPRGAELLGRLAARRPAPRPKDAAAETFVGRRRELAELQRAFASARGGRPVVALVRGRSGMGKSTLLARFGEELRASEPALVMLTSRCFEQESVPFNAVDGLVDAAGACLLGMGDAEARAALPADAPDLGRLFPSLRRVPALAGRRLDDDPRAHGVGVRRRAFAALRQLLARLAARGPLALFVDDLQWGDADSAAVLSDLLCAADAPAMFVILAFREDEAERGECLRALLPALEGRLPLVEVSVAELPHEDARALALEEMLRRGPASPERAEAAARESGGCPLFVGELCRMEAEAARPALTLDAALGARIGALGEDARRLLEVVSIAGRPVERTAALRAAGLGDSGPSHLGRLRDRRLLRLRGDRSRDEIEPYHDRVREATVARFAPDVRPRLHLALARALLATGRADAEVLASHFREGGDAAAAVEHFTIAAGSALDGLGFERAARLYREAIALLAPDDERGGPLHERLGVALAKAQRGAEAAEAFLVAAARASGAHALDLRRRAAEHYLTSGRTEAGFAVFRDVLPATGLTIPSSLPRALLVMLPHRIAVWWRGLRYRERNESEVPPDELLRLDACQSVVQGVSITHPIIAVAFQARSLHYALRAGEPRRLLWAITRDLMVYASMGHPTPSRTERELDRIAGDLVARHGDPGELHRIARGIGMVARGPLRDAADELAAADAAVVRRGPGLGSDVALARLMWIEAVALRGDWPELVRRLPDFIDEAREKSDIYLEVTLVSTAGHIPHLANDRPDLARREIERVEALWPDHYNYQATCRLLAFVQTELYRERGAGPGALAVLEERWPALVRSRMMRISRTLRARFLAHRAVACLAAAVSPTRRDGLLREVERDARALDRVRTPLAAGIGAGLRGAIARLRGERDRAIDLWTRAEADMAGTEQLLYAATLRRHRGELAGDRALVASADAMMRERGIKDPARMAAAFLPGAW